ncbi:MAG: PolC-type DNA polymerase III [Syntrophomonas sp.]|nr:PolC-type DNA polymerase III [Syntrophomonas sp.]
MSLSFQVFISGKVSDDLLPLWADTHIKKVEISRNNQTWILHLIIPAPLPAAAVSETQEQLLHYHDFLKEIVLNPLLADTYDGLSELVRTNQRDLAAALFKGGEDLFDSPAITWHYRSQGIDIVCQREEIYARVIGEGICTSMGEWLRQHYSISIIVRAILENVQTGAERSGQHYLAEGKLEVIEPLPEIARSGRRGGASRDRNKLVETIRDRSVPIASLEEGLKTAVIEGEVWDKKVVSMQEGLTAVYYFLTDHNDTMIVKAFWSQPDFDRIKIGDRIKVKGGTRFDARIKETALFLDQYAQLDKDLRRDDTDTKRIELHAHTKMSAMDGLTEIKELLKRAVQWRHPAIAITDHASIQAFPVAYAAQKELNRGNDHKIKIIYGVEGYMVERDKKERPWHIIILACNSVGLKNLYRLVSLSYLDHFYRQPRIPRQELIEHREGLLLGTACEAGELFRALVDGAEPSQLESIAAFYDYLEIQPRANNSFMIRKGLVSSEEDLLDLNRQIVNLGRRLGKTVVATGDVHFLDPHHEKYRTIIKGGQDYEDAEEHLPLYFRTTEEMLAEFAYLGPEEAERVVIEGPALVSAQVEDLKPVPDGFYPPRIEGAETEIADLTWQQAHVRYGPILPELVEERIKRELDSIIGHGFAVLYLVAHKLVKKSNQDGYMVGSRGSVGSSLVAFLTGITEVNALPPHYICPDCYYCEFVTANAMGCGADLDDKTCPGCGHDLAKDGFDIPFETFMGFAGDKVPDIDLNFSGDYQSQAHQYVEELFGRQSVFRAGTISTIADKTAFGFVKKYAEKQGADIKNSEMSRLVAGITGVRRTTGQHPGGLIVVPTDKDVMDFTPLQHPADNKDSGVITTHFEYHAIGDQLVKLDILGHDDPTVIKELEDLTGIKASQLSLSDRQTMNIFSGVEPLGVRSEDIGTTVGTFGIPEFGTPFVRQMLETTRPTTFAELVRISGLSHGTDVWLHNAQELIESNTATLNEVICTRDDIMTYLIHQDMNKTQAFEIMEKVRKGRGLGDHEIDLMARCRIPQWYIEACQKIKYMFPKAHAVAYVTMAFRIAWFKINYPLAFYSSFFGIRAEDFEAETILNGYEIVRERIREISKLGFNASHKEKRLLTVLELALEMYARGFHFQPVDIYKSDARKFIISGSGLIMPFAALANIGAAAAQGIISSRQNGDYLSIEDFQVRTRLNKSGMDILRQENCFADLPEKNQMSLFA